MLLFGVLNLIGGGQYGRRLALDVLNTRQISAEGRRVLMRWPQMLFGQSIGLVEKLLRLRIVPLALAKLAQRAESLSQLGVRRTKTFSQHAPGALEVRLCLLQLTRLQTQSTEGKQRPVQANV